MSALINHTNIKPLLQNINLPLYFSSVQEDKKVTAMQLSKYIGRSKNYLYKQLQNPDQPISIIVMLSIHLQYNFFEPVLTLLPENIRPTKAELALQQQIAALQKELEEVKKERDIYKGIVMK